LDQPLAERTGADRLDTSRVTHQLAEARAHAARVGLTDSLEGKLRYLGDYARPLESRCTLYHDHAPYSFAFTLEVKTRSGVWQHWFSGALIYHGPHDGGGSGSGPTFAVALEPTHGWLIHT